MPHKRKLVDVKKLRLKPWLTAGLIKSIRYKNRLFKNIVRHYDNKIDNMIKFDEYKRYRNVLHRMIEKANHNYYNDLVLDNKKQ